REGSKGPLAFEFAAVRVWAVRHRDPGPPIWLLIRRSLEEEPEVKYSVSNAGAETPLGVLAGVACSRHRALVSTRVCRRIKLLLCSHLRRFLSGWRSEQGL